MGQAMGALGAIGSGLGKVGGAVKNAFSPDAMKLQGTDYTRGELKAGGWTNDDLAKGDFEPTTGQRVSRGILGTLAGGANGYEKENTNSGGGTQITAPQAPSVDFSQLITPPMGYPKRRNNSMLLGG